MSVSHLFQKGQSGNRYGTTSEHHKFAMKFKYECAREAYKRLPILLRLIDSEDTPPNVRINAINALCDRGFGKAAQSLLIEDNTQDKPASQLTKAEMDSYLANDAVQLAISMVKRQEPALLEVIKEFSNKDKDPDKPTD